MATLQPPPRLAAPEIPPYQPPKPFGYVPPTPGTFTGTAPGAQPVGAFTGQAPTAQPYGAFTGTAPTATPMQNFVAPDPTKVADSPYYQFRLSQGQNAIERGAAARGTLLTGGLQTRLAEFGQGLASEEADKDYQRALATYGANSATNAQNFGQGMQGYQASLAGYGTNRDTANQNFGQQQTAYQDALAGYATNRDTAAQNAAQQQQAFQDQLAGVKTNADITLASGAQGLTAATAGYDRNAAAGRTAYEDAAADAMRRTGVSNANNLSAYQAQMFEYQRQQDEARRAQEMNLVQQDRDRQRQEDYARQMAEFDRRNKEEADRRNAALALVKPEVVPTSLVYPKRRQAGVSLGA